jgi:hypothetical protein
MKTEDWQVTVRSVYGRASSDQRYALARVLTA